MGTGVELGAGGPCAHQSEASELVLSIVLSAGTSVLCTMCAWGTLSKGADNTLPAFLCQKHQEASLAVMHRADTVPMSLVTRLSSNLKSCLIPFFSVSFFLPRSFPQQREILHLLVL